MIQSIPLIVQGITALADKLWPDPAERAKKLAEIEQMRAAGDLEFLDRLQKIDVAQLEVNNTEAQHASIFVAGWRPFIGWVCGVVLAVYYVPAALIGGWLWVRMSVEAGQILPRPDIGLDELLPVLVGMLGLGAMRTAEKIKGVARNAAPVTKLPWLK